MKHTLPLVSLAFASVIAAASPAGACGHGGGGGGGGHGGGGHYSGGVGYGHYGSSGPARPVAIELEATGGVTGSSLGDRTFTQGRMEGFTGAVLSGQGRDFGVSHPLILSGGLRGNVIVGRYAYVGAFVGFGGGAGDSTSGGLSSNVDHGVSMMGVGVSAGAVYGAGPVRVRAGVDLGYEVYSASITNHALFNCDNQSVSTSVGIVAPRVSAEVSLDPAHVVSLGAYGTVNVIDPNEFGGGAYLSIASNLFDRQSRPASPYEPGVAPETTGTVWGGVDHTPDPRELPPAAPATVAPPPAAPQQLPPILVAPKTPTQGASNATSFAPPPDVEPGLQPSSTL